MVTRRAGALLLVIVLVLGIGAVAGAKKKHKKKHPGRAWGSQVTLSHPTSTEFVGAVSSNLAACASSRLVTLTYTDPNTNQTSPLSVQRTDGSGRYQVTLTKDAYAGSYQVLVDERRIRALKAKQSCNATRSQIIGVAATG
jgi:hypothetical protein